MVVRSFGDVFKRLEAWNLAGRADAITALVAKVEILFTDMLDVLVFCATASRYP